MTASRDITKDNPTMAASFLEKIISKLHEEGRYPKGLFDSPPPSSSSSSLSPVCCNKQSIHHPPFVDHISASYYVCRIPTLPYALWGLIVIGFRLSSVASTVAT